MATEGMRERKKRQTREAIADVAVKLFLERGFDAVTVAEIARAADVSEQTVYNHFPTKERLLFHDVSGRTEAMLEAIGDPDVSPVKYFRAQTLEWLDDVVSDPVEETVKIPRVALGSPSLRAHMVEAWSAQAEQLAGVLAQRSGAPPDDAVPWFAAHALLWAHRTIFQLGVRRLLEGQDKRVVAIRLRIEAETIYKLLEKVLEVMGAPPRRRKPRP